MKNSRTGSATLVLLVAVAMVAVLDPSTATANCNSCYLPRINRERSYSLGADRQSLFADVRYEYQDWKTGGPPTAQPEPSHHKKSGAAADDEAGHDEHNRSREQYTHFTLGANWSEEVTVLAHTAFVERFELSDRGISEEEGIGDTDLVGIWRFLRFETGYVGGLFGAKVPTGDSTRRGEDGAMLQPELQPGTGSFDFSAGPLFELQMPSWILRGNALYSFRNGGPQEYTFGNSLSLSLFADYVVRETNSLSVYAGVDVNYQSLERDNRIGQAVRDSGGSLIFLGPTLTLKFSERIITSAALLFPVFQDRGGNHQELSQVMMISARYLY